MIINEIISKKEGKLLKIKYIYFYLNTVGSWRYHSLYLAQTHFFLSTDCIHFNTVYKRYLFSVSKLQVICMYGTVSTIYYRVFL